MSSIVLACLCLSAFVPKAEASVVKNGTPCKKVGLTQAQLNNSFSCVKENGKSIWKSTPMASASAPLNFPTSISKSNAPQFSNSLTVQTPVSISPAEPAPNCGPVVSSTDKIPNWNNSSAQLTSTWVSSGTLSVRWCPASVDSTSNGTDPIIYTATLNPGAHTCTTWTTTSCLITHVPVANYQVNLIASNQTGSDLSDVSTIQNSGVIYSCVNDRVTCDVPTTNQAFQTFGNESGGLGDCTFAAAANWEQLKLGVTLDAATVEAEFVQAGGSAVTGLSTSGLFHYWEISGIAGKSIKSVALMNTDQLTVQSQYENLGPMLASLVLSPGQAIAGESTGGGNHEVVVDGYTPQGPVIISWGQELQMTWQQWELEAVGLWRINS